MQHNVTKPHDYEANVSIGPCLLPGFLLFVRNKRLRRTGPFFLPPSPAQRLSLPVHLCFYSTPTNVHLP